MIKFDAPQESKISDIRRPSIEFESIDMETVNSAKDFADSLFNKAWDELQLDMLSEVFDCDENDFVFDFDVSDKSITDVLDEVRKNWETVDNDGKIELCERFAAVIADKLVISDPPKCVFYSDDEEGCYGFYSKDGNSININTNYFSDASETLNTIAHETRHAYQDRRAEIGETRTDELYKCNFDNYISLEYVDGYCVNFLDYQSQLVEAEAIAFADMFKL